MPKNAPAGTGRPFLRPGGIYFAVAGVCMLAAVMAIGAAAAARLQARAIAASTDFDSARLYARSAIELGTYLANQSGFRSTYVNGTRVSSQSIGAGTLDGSTRPSDAGSCLDRGADAPAPQEWTRAAGCRSFQFEGGA